MTANPPKMYDAFMEYGKSAETRYISLLAIVGKARSGGDSVRALARKCGLAHSTLQNALAGRYKLGTRAASAIARATGTRAVLIDGVFMWQI